MKYIKPILKLILLPIFYGQLLSMAFGLVYAMFAYPTELKELACKVGTRLGEVYRKGFCRALEDD